MSPQLPRAYMNPMVLFSLRVKEKLGEAENFARNVALSQSSSLGHENGVAPQAETAVVADVDMRGTSGEFVLKHLGTPCTSSYID